MTAAAGGGGSPTVLAFDYGLKRIGVAVGNLITSTSGPLTTLAAVDGEPDWAALAACLGEWRPGTLVVGIPYNMDGSHGPLTARAERFADELHARFGLPVQRVDERLSSRAAEDLLRQRRRSGELGRRVRRDDVDREAASVLLRQWLDSR